VSAGAHPINKSERNAEKYSACGYRIHLGRLPGRRARGDDLASLTMAVDASPSDVALEEIRRILDSLSAERSGLDPERDAVLLAANAIAIRYWREALACRLHEPTAQRGRAA
jgi:hypothetical protein